MRAYAPCLSGSYELIDYILLRNSPTCVTPIENTCSNMYVVYVDTYIAGLNLNPHLWLAITLITSTTPLKVFNLN